MLLLLFPFLYINSMLLHGRGGLFQMTAKTRRLNLNLMFKLVLGVDVIFSKSINPLELDKLHNETLYIKFKLHA